MNRETLPNRRESETISFVHESLVFHATVSRFADGRIGEIFIDLEKNASGAATAARDAAIAASISLQYGAPVETLRKALSRLSDGSGAGPLARALDFFEEAQ